MVDLLFGEEPDEPQQGGLFQEPTSERQPQSPGGLGFQAFGASPAREPEYSPDQFAPQQERDTFSFGDILDFDDLFFFAPRAVEGLVRSIGDLANLIPGVDVNLSQKERLLGRSDSIVGGLAEGFTQFLIPFGAASKSLALAGSTLRTSLAGARTATAASRATRAGLFATSNKIAASAVAGGIADSIAFSGQEQRLANFLIQVPVLRNGVTEYLAASPDDSEAEGRLKNVLEGLALGGIADVVLGAVRAVRRTRQGVANGETITDALNAGEALGPDPVSTSQAVQMLDAEPHLVQDAAILQSDTLKQVC